MYDRGVGLRIETPAGEKLFFGIRSGHYYLACRDPVILPDEQLVVFRCGGWILVMDLASRRVGCLVRGDSMVLDASACGPPPEEWLAEE